MFRANVPYLIRRRLATYASVLQNFFVREIHHSMFDQPLDLMRGGRESTRISD
jgi:hypothetical protein